MNCLAYKTHSDSVAVFVYGGSVTSMFVKGNHALAFCVASSTLSYSAWAAYRPSC
jgi:hypothetical protein